MGDWRALVRLPSCSGVTSGVGRRRCLTAMRAVGALSGAVSIGAEAHRERPGTADQPSGSAAALISCRRRSSTAVTSECATTRSTLCPGRSADRAGCARPAWSPGRWFPHRGGRRTPQPPATQGTPTTPPAVGTGKQTPRPPGDRGGRGVAPLPHAAQCAGKEENASRRPDVTGCRRDPANRATTPKSPLRASGVLAGTELHGTVRSLGRSPARLGGR
jgi:hypothetical protein